MDCFFAAVEVLDNPGLAGKAIAVGGDPRKRGVIATCSYEAREFGIHSAMASARAMTLCPHLQIIAPRINRYREISSLIRGIFAEFTSIIEPLSLDEAYLDVTDVELLRGSATLIAAEIRQRIHQQTGLTASAGVAPNKMLAKIASDWNKPDGQFVITPAGVAEFVSQLPVSKLSGVGKVTASKMKRAGVHSCGDLQRWSKIELNRHFGSFGQNLYHLCRGIDERPLETNRVRKSISVERTFTDDRDGVASCLSELPGLMDKLEQRLSKFLIDQRADRGNRLSSFGIIRLVVKIKFSDFTQTTVQQGGNRLDVDAFSALMERGLARNRKAVRLIGLGIRLGKSEAAPDQLDLFG